MAQQARLLSKALFPCRAPLQFILLCPAVSAPQAVAQTSCAGCVPVCRASTCRLMAAPLRHASTGTKADTLKQSPGEGPAHTQVSTASWRSSAHACTSCGRTHSDSDNCKCAELTGLCQNHVVDAVLTQAAVLTVFCCAGMARGQTWCSRLPHMPHLRKNMASHPQPWLSGRQTHT